MLLLRVMKAHVLLFGAGKSATVLIDYLISNAKKEHWVVQVVDADLAMAEQKTQKRAHSHAFGFDIAQDTEARQSLIANAAIVISLLPPHLHMLVAKDCIKYQRNLLTASYLDEATKALANEIKDNNLLFLYEMGLDPGIDHMSAMQIIDDIKTKGGVVSSFKSHCGGLVAPESDDNPWHYKISWNPRNVVLAGKAGAVYQLAGAKQEVTYAQMFANEDVVRINDELQFGYYPNRDSLAYINTYNLPEAHTFLRTTLRHPDFIYGWNNLIALGFTDEEKKYDSNNKSLADLFKEHLDAVKFSEWLTKTMSNKIDAAKQIMESLMSLEESEDELMREGVAPDASIMSVDEQGHLHNDNVEAVKYAAAATVEKLMHQNNLNLKLLFYLGMDDKNTLVNKGVISAADLLQFALEQKLVLQPKDKDMIVMLHEIAYELNGATHEVKSSLVVKGNNSKHTAMAKTVGLPLGIAAKLILNGTITDKGLNIPIAASIYKPVLQELRKEGIVFEEQYL